MEFFYSHYINMSIIPITCITPPKRKDTELKISIFSNINQSFSVTISKPDSVRKNPPDSVRILLEEGSNPLSPELPPMNLN